MAVEKLQTCPAVQPIGIKPAVQNLSANKDMGVYDLFLSKECLINAWSLPPDLTETTTITTMPPTPKTISLCHIHLHSPLSTLSYVLD